MRNHGDETITLYAGHRIAQMVIARTEYLEPIEAKISANDSERGEGAFGSTGKNNVNGLTKYATDKQTDTQPLKNVKFLLPPPPPPPSWIRGRGATISRRKGITGSRALLPLPSPLRAY